MITNQIESVGSYFNKEAKKQKLFVPLEDFVQECWVQFVESDDSIPRQERLDTAIKNARKYTRPHRTYQQHITEIPLESLENYSYVTEYGGCIEDDYSENSFP